jgi:hypothetical protein
MGHNSESPIEFEVEGEKGWQEKKEQKDSKRIKTLIQPKTIIRSQLNPEANSNPLPT